MSKRLELINKVSGELLELSTPQIEVILDLILLFNTNYIPERYKKRLAVVTKKITLNKAIVESDRFLEMRADAKYLYYVYVMCADFSGIVRSPKRIMRQHSVAEFAYALLIKNKYISVCDDGSILINHWTEHFLDVGE